MGDPGCYAPWWPSENAECADGIDNNGDGKMDYDGAYSRTDSRIPNGRTPIAWACRGEGQRVRSAALDQS